MPVWSIAVRRMQGCKNGDDEVVKVGAAAIAFWIHTGKSMGSAKDASCISDRGAEDMSGNLWKQTVEWYAARIAGTPPSPYTTPRPSAVNHGGDGTWWISSSARDGYRGSCRAFRQPHFLAATATPGPSPSSGFGVAGLRGMKPATDASPRPPRSAGPPSPSSCARSSPHSAPRDRQPRPTPSPPRPG